MADRVERCFVKTAKMIEDAGGNPQPVADKLVIEIPRGASLEEDEDLHTMWAALLANTASPETSEKVRPSSIAVLKQMAHDEAALLNWIFKYCSRPQEKEDQRDPSTTELGFLELTKAWVELGFASEASFEHYYIQHQDVQQFIVCRERLAANGLIKVPADDDTVRKLTLFGCQFIESCNPPVRTSWSSTHEFHRLAARLGWWSATLAGIGGNSLKTATTIYNHHGTLDQPAISIHLDEQIINAAAARVGHSPSCGHCDRLLILHPPNLRRVPRRSCADTVQYVPLWNIWNRLLECMHLLVVSPIGRITANGAFGCPNAGSACVSSMLVYNKARRSYKETGGDSQMEFLVKHIGATLHTFVHANQHHNLIEYALMAGFVVAATLAVVPGLSDSISTTFGKGARVVTSRDTGLSLPIPIHER